MGEMRKRHTERLEPQRPGALLPSGTQAAVALALTAGLSACAVGLVGGPWDVERAPFPYVWRDVAIVHVLCALPLAWVAAAAVNRRLTAAGSVVLAAVALGVGVAPFLGPIRTSGVTDFQLGVVLRALPALGLTTSATLVAAAFGGQRTATGRSELGIPTAVFGLCVAVWLVVPSIYVGERCRRDAARLGEFLEQSRYGEARGLLHGLLALDGRRKWNGDPLPRVAEDVDRIVRALESRVSVPLAVAATADEQLDRARQLAMLGRTSEAVDILKAVRDPSAAPEVDTLHATICENRGEWEAGLGLYQSARAAWESRPQSPAREAGLLRATTGVAYCQRKSGRYAEAEATYRQVLALSPTADSHFLLAQFYEDAQQAGNARTHARRAMEIDPARYQQEGDRLITKLTVFHFGCLGVFDAENDRPNSSLAQ